MFIRLGHILKLVFIIYILRYSHRKAMWLIFIRKWVLANQRNERCFTREKNDTPNQNHARNVFLGVQKERHVQSKATEFRAKIPSFYRLLKLAAPSPFEKICMLRLSGSVLEKNSFVYLTVNEENCREQAKQQQKWRKKKQNETEVSLSCSFERYF